MNTTNNSLGTKCAYPPTTPPAWSWLCYFKFGVRKASEQHYLRSAEMVSQQTTICQLLRLLTLCNQNLTMNTCLCPCLSSNKSLSSCPLFVPIHCSTRLEWCNRRKTELWWNRSPSIKNRSRIWIDWFLVLSIFRDVPLETETALPSKEMKCNSSHPKRHVHEPRQSVGDK